MQNIVCLLFPKEHKETKNYSHVSYKRKDWKFDHPRSQGLFRGRG